jgi:hypothetical protein
MYPVNRSGILLLAVFALSMPAAAQQHESSSPAGGPFSDVVLNAPFSARAVTKVREPLPDGTIREHTVTATYYRDSQGRVRAALDNPWGQYVVLWIPGAERSESYALDPDTRTYRNSPRHPAQILFNGEGRVALPVGKACFRVSAPVAGASATERLEAVHAEVSPDLGVVIASHRSDGPVSVDYELTNIRRGEPPPELFEVPGEYTFVRGSRLNPLIQLGPWDANRFCRASGR